MEKLCAELTIKIKKKNLNEAKVLQKWRQLISNSKVRGFDVSHPSSIINEAIPLDEFWVVLRSGEETKSPDYKEMYALLGEFIRFLHGEMSYIGTIKISLERKCLVFEVQTQIP